MKRLRLCLGFLLLSILVVGLLWLLAPAKETSLGNRTPVSTHEEERPGRRSSLEQPPLVEPAERREASRSEVRSLRGHVRSVAGHPIPGARVLWIALTKADVEPAQSWGSEVSVALETATDASGLFELGEPKDHPRGSVLLALHAEHYPAGIDLAADAGDWPVNPELVLEPGTPIQVSVVDPAGRPQGGATVHHAGLPRSPDPEQPPIQAFERFLARDAVTTTDGRIELPPFRGEQVMWAEKGELVSVPWQGVQPSSVVLTLGDSFTLGGTVTFPDSSTGTLEGTEQRILVSGLKGNIWRQLACIRDVREGVWGPLHVPLEGIARYTVSLAGTRIIPVMESFDRPRRASHQRVDFVAREGAELHLEVKNESKEPIPTARAEAWWGPRMASSARVHGTAGKDGVIRLGAFPPGLVHFSVVAPGYAGLEFMEIEVSGTTRVEATLEEGGSIAGRCVHDGMPVTDFEVIYWKVANVRLLHSEPFLGREDGRFEIEGLAPGDWSIHAASPSLPCGRPVTVSVGASSAARVELELPTAIRGGGRVIDADTGGPVVGARVQPYSSGGLDRGLPWGAGTLTSEDGSFDLDAFALGLNHLTVEADGFAMGEAETNATARDFVDWGEIRLVRPQLLQVSLLGLEALSGIGPEDFRASTEQGHILPEKGFDSQGIVRYSGVPPGDLRLLVARPDGSWARLQLQLDPGKEWSFDVKVAGYRRLDVHVADAAGRTLPYVPSVLVRAQEESGVLVLRYKETEGGRASFEGIRAAKAQVSVLDSDLNYVASRDVALAAEASTSIEMLIGEEPFRVHILDADRAPVPGASVRVRSRTGAETHGLGETDANGWAELVGLPSGPLLMDVQHGVVGRSFGNPIDASEKELEFVLEATGTLEIELLDGDLPLAGVLTRIQTEAGLTLGDARQTDDRGKVRYESLGQGNYHLACHRTDCWPTTVDEELAPGEQACVRVQMRRLADLEFSLLSPDGLPVSGVTVELVSDEFGLPIDAWLDEEGIRAPGGLTTDARGSIRVEGLPRGSYSWSVSVLDESFSGSIELEAGRTNEAKAYLPR